MWSFSSSSQSKNTTEPPLRNNPRFFSIHSFLNTAKKLFEKIREARPFRRPRSVYSPYNQCRSMYMNNELSNMASSSGDGSKESTVLYDYEFVGIRRSARPRHLLEMDVTDESTTSDWVYRESEHENNLHRQLSADDELKCKENQILGPSNGVSKHDAATNPIIARDSKAILALPETQITSNREFVIVETGSSSQEIHEKTELTDGGDALEINGEHHITKDLRMARLKSEAGQNVQVNEIRSNLDFQKDRSPGSTIETKSKGKKVDCRDHSNGNDANRESPLWAGVEVEHVLTTSTGSSRVDSSGKGSPGTRWKRNRRRRRPPRWSALAKFSFRGTLYRAHHKLKRFLATKVR